MGEAYIIFQACLNGNCICKKATEEEHREFLKLDHVRISIILLSLYLEKLNKINEHKTMASPLFLGVLDEPIALPEADFTTSKCGGFADVHPSFQRTDFN